MKTLLRTGFTAVIASALLVGCGSTDTLEETSTTADTPSEPIVIGSQDYYSSEIIAELYAQALEAADYDVQRDFRIGQREVYMGEVENGSVDLFPEYTGPLLQYWVPDTDARLSDEVYSELVDAAPDGLTLLDAAPATDQDAYVVTRELAEQYDLTSISDLANIPGPLVSRCQLRGRDPTQRSHRSAGELRHRGRFHPDRGRRWPPDHQGPA